MSAVTPATQPDGSQQAVVKAALVLLERMGLSPADLAAAPRKQKAMPTFAEYVPLVSAAVSAGTRRAYDSYWNRILEHWGDRRLDEIAPSEIRQLMTWVKAHVVARRNARGGRSAQEHLVAALRCLYQRAVEDGLIAEADNPARKVAKPRRRVRPFPPPPAQHPGLRNARDLQESSASPRPTDDIHPGSANRRTGSPPAAAARSHTRLRRRAATR
jgi:hypothetical protein